jgi:hypothetical protein
MFSRRKSIAFAAAAAAVAALGLSVYTASAGATAAPPYTCNGGSIPGGTYSSLIVNGNCNVDDGTVHVIGDVTVKPNASLIAAFGGSDLIVGGSVNAGKNTNLVFGCSPYDFTCYGESQGGYSTTTIQHDLVATGARAILVHGAHIGGSVTQTGGGGGLACGEPGAAPAVFVTINPAYTTYSDTSIGGDLTITGVKTCWLGVTRVDVGMSMTFTGNKTGDSDGNELVSNHIVRNLACVGNRPAPQIGDSGGNLNFVGGLATGQCKKLAGVVKTTTFTDDAPVR